MMLKKVQKMNDTHAEMQKLRARSFSYKSRLTLLTNLVLRLVNTSISRNWKTKKN